MSLVSFTYFADKLPYRTALKKYSGNILLLSYLYRAIGNGLAFKRYGKCWDYFPADLSEEDLSQTISMLRKHFKTNKDAISFTLKSVNCQIFYENITRSQLKKMLHCAYALKQDLHLLKERQRELCIDKRDTN
ncbi:MAG: hypothetical protein AABY44_03625 [Nitrospirota bacterium]